MHKLDVNADDEENEDTYFRDSSVDKVHRVGVSAAMPTAPMLLQLKLAADNIDNRTNTPNLYHSQRNIMCGAGNLLWKHRSKLIVRAVMRMR
jgi:hypothetical protein